MWQVFGEVSSMLRDFRNHKGIFFSIIAHELNVQTKSVKHRIKNNEYVCMFLTIVYTLHVGFAHL